MYVHHINTKHYERRKTVQFSMQEDINAFFLRENYPNSIPRENAQLGCFDHPFFVVLLNIFAQVVFLNLND